MRKLIVYQGNVSSAKHTEKNAEGPRHTQEAQHGQRELTDHQMMWRGQGVGRGEQANNQSNESVGGGKEQSAVAMWDRAGQQ